MMVNSKGMINQNRDMTDHRRLLDKTNKVREIYSQISVISQIMANPPASKNTATVMMLHPIQDLPTRTMVSTVTLGLAEGSCSPQVWWVLHLRDRPLPLIINKVGGGSKKDNHPTYSLSPEPTKQIMGQSPVSLVTHLRSKVIPQRQARSRAVAMLYPCIIAHMRRLVVLIVTAQQHMVVATKVTAWSNMVRALLGQQVKQRGQGCLGSERKSDSKVVVHNMAALSSTKGSGSHMTSVTIPNRDSRHVIGQQLPAADHKSTVSRRLRLGTCRKPVHSNQSQRLTQKHLKHFWQTRTTFTPPTSSGQKAKTNYILSGFWPSLLLACSVTHRE